MAPVFARAMPRQAGNIDPHKADEHDVRVQHRSQHRQIDASVGPDAQPVVQIRDPHQNQQADRNKDK